MIQHQELREPTVPPDAKASNRISGCAISLAVVTAIVSVIAKILLTYDSEPVVYTGIFIAVSANMLAFLLLILSLISFSHGSTRQTVMGVAALIVAISSLIIVPVCIGELWQLIDVFLFHPPTKWV